MVQLLNLFTSLNKEMLSRNFSSCALALVHRQTVYHQSAVTGAALPFHNSLIFSKETKTIRIVHVR